MAEQEGYQNTHQSLGGLRAHEGSNTGLLQLVALVREGCCRTVFPQRTQAAKHPPRGVRSPR